jgi:hypothetical protein
MCSAYFLTDILVCYGVIGTTADTSTNNTKV